jgi:hypothetical protein
VHSYTQTIHRTTQFTNEEECRPCPVFARYTLAFALQLRKKYGKTLVINSKKNGIRILYSGMNDFKEGREYT